MSRQLRKDTKKKEWKKNMKTCNDEEKKKKDLSSRNLVKEIRR